MQVHRSQQFKRWVDELVAKAKGGDERAVAMSKHVLDELNYIKNLDKEPDEDTATMKRVRQSRKYQVWRLSHPYVEGMAVRIVCWFDSQADAVVVVLFAADKAPMGDVFYDSVGPRADQEIDKWIAARERKIR